MKTIFITSLLTIMTITFTTGGTKDQNREAKRTSMAEQDFMDCAKIKKDCIFNINSKYCTPEIIIVKEDGNILTSGEASNEVIRELLKVSDFLTAVDGSNYYRLNELEIMSDNSTLVAK